MNEVITKLLIFAFGFIVGWLIKSIFAGKKKRSLEDQIDVMRIASGKQDDAIRRKQNRIDELEREARREKRKGG